MKRIALEDLWEAGKQKPGGYAEAVIAAGRIDGDVLLLDDDAYWRLRSKWSGVTKPPEHPKNAFRQYLDFARQLSENREMSAAQKAERLVLEVGRFGLSIAGSQPKLDGRILIIAQNLKTALEVSPEGAIRYGRFDPIRRDVSAAMSLKEA